MARKQEFDPLGGFVGGGSARKSRKDKKSYDVLGSGKYGDSGSIFDEGTYEPAEVTGYSDALLATGTSQPQEKPQKRGFFSGLFKKKESRPASQLPAEAPVRDPGFDSRGVSSIEIKNDIMDTGIIQRYGEPKDDGGLFDDEPEVQQAPASFAPAPSHADFEPRAEPQRDDAPLFDDEPVPQTEFIEEAAASPQSADDDLFSEVAAPAPTPAAAQAAPASAAPVSLNPRVCHLCGRTSQDEWPEFGFSEDEFVPLCKTCTRAVTTLLKHTDPAEEEEIISEWSLICPGLDEARAKELVAKGRRLHRQ
ncbi:MAG TPA: hypothetical protein O0X70_02280 [Methanocorpusculum sp.]|nr:hypothetical protein [Methanocorpusculum sp.]